MENIRVVSDLDECRRVWRQVVPGDHVSDLWDFRLCFHRCYQRPLHFVVEEEGGSICGLLPLSWIEERGYFGYFPGELWHGKTWLEQNRLFVRDGAMMQRMLNHLGALRPQAGYHLRYLLPSASLPEGYQKADEIGYLFNPPEFAYSMDNYFQRFSHKSVKRITREIEALEARGLEVRRDRPDDFDLMVQLSLDRYGDHSYFSDGRFTESFREAMHFLAEQGWLRMTTIILEGEPAAVDMGCIYRGVYTLLGGGTNGRFPGVAKLINLYHMRRACEEKLTQVDFLCGDFSWKTMFHLTPRPLYVVSNLAELLPAPDAAATASQPAPPEIPTVVGRGTHA